MINNTDLISSPPKKTFQIKCCGNVYNMDVQINEGTERDHFKTHKQQNISVTSSIDSEDGNCKNHY